MNWNNFRKPLVTLLTLVSLSATLAARDDWTVYLADRNADTVTPVAASNNSVDSPIPTGLFPSDAIVSPNGRTLYVANAGFAFGPVTPGSVTIIDTRTKLVQGTISFSSVLSTAFFPARLALTPDGQTLYVSGVDDSNNNYVIPISTATSVPATPISAGTGGMGTILITPDGATAFVLSASASRVFPIDLTTQTAGTVIDFATPYYLTSMALTPDGSTLYITPSNLELYSVDVASQTPGPPLSLPYVPSDIAITPDGTTAYLPCPNGGNTILLPIDLTTQTIGTPINTSPDQPSGIAITPDGATAYVTTFSGVTLPIDLATQTIGTPINVNGTTVAISPDQAPVARFTAGSGLANAPTTFDASTSTTDTGTIVSYAWNFGDGHAETNSLPTTLHVYAANGSYAVTLTVVNSAGTSTTRTYNGASVVNNGGPTATLSRAVTISPPTRVSTRGIIGSCGFSLDLTVKNGRITGNLSCWDPRVSLDLRDPKFTSLTFNGNQATIVGSAVLPKFKAVTFTVRVTDNGLGGGTFSITMSNGYSASGTVVGTVQIQ